MRALVEACEADSFPARAVLVLSNRPDAQGLEYARKKNIPVTVIDHASYADRQSFEAAILEALKNHDIDLICLAGFMRILSPYFIENWPGQIINIHPSLLPDYKGLNTHERVLADGKSESGCTVHHVTADMDSGPVIIQKRVPVLPEDTPDTLADRILEQEHIAYPEAVRALASART